MVQRILHEAAEQSLTLQRAIYVMRIPGSLGWTIAPQLSCPCCLLAMVFERQVVRWMH